LKNVTLPLLIVTLLVAILAPQHGLAETTLQQATNELEQAEAKQKQAAENLKNAQSKIKKIQVERQKTKKDIFTLEDDIDSLENQIMTLDQEMNALDIEITALDIEIESLSEQIDLTNTELKSLENKSDQVEADLLESKRLLQEAIERIEARDSLIRERLRYMYTNGSVPYLEVLFHSTSFTDFLDRFQILKTLVNHDQDILEANKSDYEQVALQIVEVEQQLVELVALYDQQLVIKDKQTLAKEDQIAAKDKQLDAKDRQVAAKHTQIAAKNKLIALKQTKNNQIAALNKEEQILAEYTEEQEKEMIAAAALVAASKKSIAYYKGDKLGYPLIETYRISSNFGKRTNPITGKTGTMHNGIDFAAPAGTSILAAESGRVITAGWVSGYGNTVIIDHGNGLWTLYAHARKDGIQVEVGEIIERGQKISEVGKTGNSTGYHLHFEVRLNEKAVDPRDYLNL
jgi:murein DD-endopeptidase MepM/ murein hydrolase activator NlpD